MELNKFKELAEKISEVTCGDPITILEDLLSKADLDYPQNKKAYMDYWGPIAKEAFLKEELDISNAEETIFDLYWNGISNEEISKRLDLNHEALLDFFLNRLPINLVMEKYNSGMQPSKIKKDPEVKKALNMKLETNHIRRMLNMSFV